MTTNHFPLQKIFMESIIEWDRELLLWLNSFHTPWLDPVMWLITKTAVWIPLYLFLAYLIFRNYKKEGWLILAGMGLAILLADRITTGLMKPYFERLRPSHDPSLEGLVHLVRDYRGGLYGFASSHAANTLAVATLMWMVFKDKYRQIGWLFAWAFLMSYSRIYLGVHYPGDILAGWMIGILSAWAGFRFYHLLRSRRNKGSSDQIG